MLVLKLLFIFGVFIKNVILFDPMLTYTVRFKKLFFQPSHFGNFTVHQYRETQFMNGHFTLPSNTTVDTVIGIFYRCDADGINCEYFQTWTLTDICNKLKDKNQLWSRLYGSIDPPLVCPFDKVHYQMKNGTFDIGLAIMWYPQVTDYQWKLIQKVYYKDRCIVVVVFELSIFGYRKKIKFIPKL